jgi:hypothetical protein
MIPRAPDEEDREQMARGAEIRNGTSVLDALVRLILTAKTRGPIKDNETAVQFL